MADPKALLHYHVFATADLTASGGFSSLAPPSGFVDAGSGPHFFRVRCLVCGEETSKDVAVYALSPGAQTCTGTFGPRLLKKRCYPTCSNPAHMVKKCTGCRALGSIELLEVSGSLSQTSRVHFLTVDTLGYQILSYTAGQDWEATSGAGEQIPVFYSDDGFFNRSAARGRINIPVAFNVLQSTE